MSLKSTPSLLILLAIAGTLFAGEVQLRSQATVAGSVVRVGDVAEPVELSDEEWNRLAEVELFPVPAEGETRVLSSAIASELISLRLGDEAGEVPVTGQCRVVAGQVAKQSPRKEAARKESTRNESTSMVRPRRDEERRFASQGSRETLPDSPAGDDASYRTMSMGRQRLIDAARAYLSKQSSDLSTWNIDFEIDAKQADQLANGEEVRVSGPQAPWTGRQLLNVQVDDKKWFNIRATITRSVMILVAKHDLRAGDILTDDDLEEASSANMADGGLLVGSKMYVTAGDSIAEKTLMQPIAAGRPIPKAALKKTLVIEKGDMITVFSMAPGVKIKSTAKALGSAAAGELVLLEEPTTKKQFQARATAHQEAMVLVDVPKVAPMGAQTYLQQAAQAKAQLENGTLLESRQSDRPGRR